MIWVAWKQHRAGVLTALGLIVATAVVMLVMRLNIGSMLSDLGAGDCLSNPTKCPTKPAMKVVNSYGTYVAVAPLILYALPVVLGIVAGAPVFARELSQGSHMFSLTQSVSRKRWWATKLGVTLVPIAVGVGLLGMFSLWALGPVLELRMSRLTPGNFEVQGLVMVGYLVLAFMLAATFGLLTRNNVVPMVITAGIYIVITMAVVFMARQSYLPPMSHMSSDKEALESMELRSPDGSWLTNEVYVLKDGTRLYGFAELCNMDECRDDEVVSVGAEYQPGSRFWAFQGIETGAYLVLGAAALAVGARRLRALP